MPTISWPSSTCAGAARAPAQDRLEPRLRDEQAAARTERFDTRVEAADDVRELPAREAVHGDDRALGKKLFLRLALDLVLYTGKAKQLERA
jgi:hypothetical protein